MSLQLPLEAAQSILRSCPCREAQVKQLLTYYNDTYPSPPLLVASGLDQVNKIHVLTTCLTSRNLSFAIVKVRDCLSQRHLLSKIFAACISAGVGSQQTDDFEDSLQQLVDEGRYDRIDSTNALMHNLQKLYHVQPQQSKGKTSSRLVLILDGIDMLRGASLNLLPALARLGDMIPSLSLILTSTSPRPLPLHKSGVPYLHFPPYTRTEAVFILATTTPPSSLLPNSKTLPSYRPQVDEETLRKIYAQFVATVYDSLIFATTSTSLESFRNTTERLWPRFIWPLVIDEPISGVGSNSSTPRKTWDFARLLVRNRVLFQTEGEAALHDIPKLRAGHDKVPWTFEDLATTHSSLQQEDSSGPLSVPNTPTKRGRSNRLATEKVDRDLERQQHNGLKRRSKVPSARPTPLLKPFPTLVLLSSYLASNTPPKHDILLFSRLSSSSSHISKKIRRLKNTPSRKKQAQKSAMNGLAPGAGAGGDRTPSKSKNRIMKTILSSSASGSNSPAMNQLQKSFSLERLLAILRAIHPEGLDNRFGRGICDRVYRELGELERLRLIVRADGAIGGAGGAGTSGSAGTAAEDAMEEKWRINVGRQWVVDVGNRSGMSVNDYEIEGEG